MHTCWKPEYSGTDLKDNRFLVKKKLYAYAKNSDITVRGLEASNLFEEAPSQTNETTMHYHYSIFSV